jgi:hypothetical protein
LEKAIKATSNADESLKPKVTESWERVWQACDRVGAAVMERTTELRVDGVQPFKPFTQESLVALVDVIRCTRSVSRQIDGAEWPLERLTRLMAILKGQFQFTVRCRGIDKTIGVLTYTNSPDFRPDVDGLTPVQVCHFLSALQNATS